MDAFDFIEEEEPVEKKKKPRRKRNINLGALIWNFGTLSFLLSALCVGGLFLAIFLDPSSSVNPWPPPAPTLPSEATLPQPTPTEFAGPPPTPTFLPTAGPSPTATNPLLPTPTDVIIATPSPTVPSDSEFAYQLQDGNPLPLPSIIYHPALECAFLGVGGQAIDLNTAPVLGFAVQLTGTVDGEPIDLLTFTGAATQFGPGGYEIKIADAPFDSTGQLQVQLLDQQGFPLSPLIVFDTFDDCSQNMILINFVEVP
ncbi:MAG: hypothetical protein IH859_00585 [Chloroflexi bacterium]|nr:hypothetical protein [Chloroflexota bacterium]